MLYGENKVRLEKGKYLVKEEITGNLRWELEGMSVEDLISYLEKVSENHINCKISIETDYGYYPGEEHEVTMIVGDRLATAKEIDGYEKTKEKEEARAKVRNKKEKEERKKLKEKREKEALKLAEKAFPDRFK